FFSSIRRHTRFSRDWSSDVCSSDLACRGERLARAASGPDWPIVAPPCQAESMRPDSDTGEEVALSIASQVIWPDILYAPFINVKIGRAACRERVYVARVNGRPD